MSFWSWLGKTGVGRVAKHGWKGITSNGQPVFSEGGMFGAIGTAVSDLLKGNAIGNLINGATGSGLTDAQREEISAETAAQNSLNEADYYRKIDFYERFESPQAQVDQYKNAGLNPALMFQNGASVNASGGVGAGSAGDASSAVGLLSSLGGIMSSLLQNKAKMKQIETERELGKERNNIQFQLGLMGRSNEVFRNNAQKAYWDSLILETASRTLVNNETAERIKQNAEALRITNGFLPEQLRTSIDEQRSNIKLIEQKVEESKQYSKMLRANIAKISAEIKNLNSLTDLNSAAAKETLQRIENLKNENTLLGKKIGLADKELAAWNATHALRLDAHRSFFMGLLNLDDQYLFDPITGERIGSTLKSGSIYDDYFDESDPFNYDYLAPLRDDLRGNNRW